MTLSPILAGLESTLTGTTTIRAFGAEDRFLGEFFDQIDRNTAAEWSVPALGHSYAFVQSLA